MIASEQYFWEVLKISKKKIKMVSVVLEVYRSNTNIKEIVPWTEVEKILLCTFKNETTNLKTQVSNLKKKSAVWGFV